MGSERPAKRRARGIVACERCKARKQRCDNEFPSCSNCVSAGQDCSYGLKQVYPAEYVRSLENHIAELERTVATSLAPAPAPIPEVETPSTNHSHLKRRTAGSHVGTDSEHRDKNAPQEARPQEEVTSNLEIGAGIVALSPNSFLGTSSGLPLAKLLQSAVEDSNDPGQLGHAVSQSIIRLGTHSAPTSAMTLHDEAGRPNEAHIETGKADMPSAEVGEKLIDAYYARVHPKHPFLPQKRVLALHENRESLSPAHRLQTSESRRGDPCDYAILRLVYAIGARYLQLTNDEDYPSPKEQYIMALSDADAIFAVRSLESLEAMLLLTIYQLRSPSGPGVWWTIGTTMRHCLDCGLHRRATTNNASVLLDQRRKRIFWTAYMLERSVARTMGRPYAVSDRDIDVELPANIDDALDTEAEINAAIVQSMANPQQITPLTPAIHIFRLQQIESKIQHTVCRVDRPVTSIKPQKVEALRSALEEWKANIPSTSTRRHQSDTRHPYLTTDYHMTQYHKAIVLMILPFLPSLTPDHPDFRRVAYSAGQICQLSKRLHDDQTYISFSLLSLHANFIGGLVLVCCFCIDPSIFDPRFSSDIRACSTMLYIISERWPLARKVRSAFDSLVAATVEGQHRSSPPSRMGPMMPAPCSSPCGADYSAHANTVPGRLDNVPIWDSFETVLGDYQINTETWMQDSIFEAMDTFPSFDWTTFSS